MFGERMGRVRAAMAEMGIDVLLLSTGADLPWLCGYEAMPLERLTMLVVPRDAEAALVVPRLEAPRVIERPELFRLVTWEETEDPITKVLAAAGAPEVVAVGDQTWARFLMALIDRWPSARFVPASRVCAPLRAVKDPSEVEALRRAAGAVDRVAGYLQQGLLPLAGRSEMQVAADIGRMLLDEGHDRVNFVIVASGANAASPHHDPGPSEIKPGSVVLFDIGGRVTGEGGVGYCSDISRCVWIGDPPPVALETYELLADAHAAAIAAAVPGASCGEVDAAARRVISAGGLGERFLHRTGHGIGVEAHEEPYIVEGNHRPLEVGNAFSVEPGIYMEGRFGFRLEDIVVLTDRGADPLNRADHGLVSLDR